MRKLKRIIESFTPLAMVNFQIFYCHLPILLPAHILGTMMMIDHRSNFRDIPAFIHTSFQDQQVGTNPFNRQQDSQPSSYNDQPTYLGSSSLIAFTHSPLLVNGFGNPTTGISPRNSLVARYLISAALQHHASLSTKVTNCDDPDLQPTNIIIGHLPPADMLLNYHCSAFPMARLPTTEQLNSQCSPTNKSCHHLSSDLCDRSRFIYKSP
jgi:hypothetical protein